MPPELVFGASGDATVRAWNPDNGTVPRTFSGASDYLFAVAASPDGKIHGDTTTLEDQGVLERLAQSFAHED